MHIPRFVEKQFKRLNDHQSSHRKEENHPAPSLPAPEPKSSAREIYHAISGSGTAAKRARALLGNIAKPAQWGSKKRHDDGRSRSAKADTHVQDMKAFGGLGGIGNLYSANSFNTGYIEKNPALKSWFNAPFTGEVSDQPKTDPSEPDNALVAQQLAGLNEVEDLEQRRDFSSALTLAKELLAEQDGLDAANQLSPTVRTQIESARDRLEAKENSADILLKRERALAALDVSSRSQAPPPILQTPDLAQPSASLQPPVISPPAALADQPSAAFALLHDVESLVRNDDLGAASRLLVDFKHHGLYAGQQHVMTADMQQQADWLTEKFEQVIHDGVTAWQSIDTAVTPKNTGTPAVNNIEPKSPKAVAAAVDSHALAKEKAEHFRSAVQTMATEIDMLIDARQAAQALTLLSRFMHSDDFLAQQDQAEPELVRVIDALGAKCKALLAAPSPQASASHPALQENAPPKAGEPAMSPVQQDQVLANASTPAMLQVDSQTRSVGSRSFGTMTHSTYRDQATQTSASESAAAGISPAPASGAKAPATSAKPMENAAVEDDAMAKARANAKAMFGQINLLGGKGKLRASQVRTATGATNAGDDSAGGSAPATATGSGTTPIQNGKKAADTVSTASNSAFLEELKQRTQRTDKAGLTAAPTVKRPNEGSKRSFSIDPTQLRSTKANLRRLESKGNNNQNSSTSGSSGLPSALEKLQSVQIEPSAFPGSGSRAKAKGGKASVKNIAAAFENKIQADIASQFPGKAKTSQTRPGTPVAQAKPLVTASGQPDAKTQASTTPANAEG